MDVDGLLAELFGRVNDHVHEILDGLQAEDLVVQPEPGSNPVGWLIWHLTRVTDAHMSEILEQDQLWVSDGWADRFGLDPDPWNVGYGHTPAQVAEVRPDGAQVLLDYWSAVWERTQGVLASTDADDLERIVDRNWDPPVSLGVRLVSIADDDIQHAGQAAYVKGLLGRR